MKAAPALIGLVHERRGARFSICTSGEIADLLPLASVNEGRACRRVGAGDDETLTLWL